VSHLLEIKEGALFIADAHYPHHGDYFLCFLKKLESGEITTPQLFLMGDNFDLLFGYNSYIQTFVSEAIALLQKLSQTLEIHYLEGNHDFCLKTLFPEIYVYPLGVQPLYASLGEKRIAIAHGDKYATGAGYALYSHILRTPLILKLLKPWEKKIIDFQMKRLAQKKICHHFHHFEQRVEKIMHSYQEIDLVIEGHYHQAKSVGKYLSLPSLACQKQIAMVKKGKIEYCEITLFGLEF